jgi:hypothetical protein
VLLEIVRVWMRVMQRVKNGNTATMLLVGRRLERNGLNSSFGSESIGTTSWFRLRLNTRCADSLR